VFDYVSEWLSVFEIDFEYDKFYNFLRQEMGRMDGTERISRRQFETIKEFISSIDKFEVTDEMRARVYLETRDRMGISYADLSDFTGWSVGKLHGWKRRLEA
jgi:hypothetical protein